MAVIMNSSTYFKLQAGYTPCMITKGGSRTFQTSGRGGGGGGGQILTLHLINSTRVLGMECGEAYLPTVTLLQFITKQY